MDKNKHHNFPTFDELSFEQKSAVKLDLNRNNLIIGAPGTGKTIVALFRLHELFIANKKKIILLVFNRPLMLYLRMLQKELGWANEFEIYTVNDWAFYKLYSGSEDEPVTGGIINNPVPNVASSKYKIDWQQVISDFIAKDNTYDHIVVDAYGIIGLNSKDSANKGFLKLSPILFSPQMRLMIDLRRKHAQNEDLSAKRSAACNSGSTVSDVVPSRLLQRQSAEHTPDVDLHRSTVRYSKDVSFACAA